MGPESNGSRVSRSWLVDGLVVGYLILTAIFSLCLLGNGTLPIVHAGIILVVWGIRRWACDFVHQLYSTLLVPCLYMELDILSGLAGGETYDRQVMVWERSLFGDPMPAEWLSEAIPILALSELLHFCYLSFYPMLVFLALRLYFRKREHLQTYLWCTAAATFTIYFIQMWFPVQGPRPLLPPLDQSLQGPCWQLCHFLCGQGASGAAAFPSGHVMFASATTLAAWHWDPKAYRVLLPVSVGMALAVVYGRFHYAVDAIAGAFVGWLFLEYGPGWYKKISNRFENSGISS